MACYATCPGFLALIGHKPIPQEMETMIFHVPSAFARILRLMTAVPLAAALMFGAVAAAQAMATG